MDRININIRDNLTPKEALRRVFSSYSELKKTDHGVVTFNDNTVVSLRKTKANNLSFTVYRNE